MVASATRLRSLADSMRGSVTAGDNPTGRCVGCGCTDKRACPGGCHWVGPDLCSRCLPKVVHSFAESIHGIAIAIEEEHLQQSGGGSCRPSDL